MHWFVGFDLKTYSDWTGADIPINHDDLAVDEMVKNTLEVWITVSEIYKVWVFDYFVLTKHPCLTKKISNAPPPIGTYLMTNYREDGKRREENKSPGTYNLTVAWHLLHRWATTTAPWLLNNKTRLSFTNLELLLVWAGFAFWGNV